MKHTNKARFNPMCYSVTVTCPACGFLARPLCSNDGDNWRYVCERCGAIFEL